MAQRKKISITRTTLAERLKAAVKLFQKKEDEGPNHKRCKRCRVRFPANDAVGGEYCSQRCSSPAPRVNPKIKTRQMIRYELREKSRADIEHRHGGGHDSRVAAEPRRNRRKMIRGQASRWWRESRGITAQ